MAYKLMKRIIERGLKDGNLDKASVMDKLDAFLAADRMSTDDYKELVKLAGGEA